jgi:hypothetical protein
MIQKCSHDCFEWRAPFPEFEFVRVLFAQLVGRPLPEGYVLRTEGYDWSRAMRLVENHRFWGPAAKHVREHRGEFPCEFAEKIEKRYRAKCLQNMVAARRLVQMRNAFLESGQDVTFFKGPILAQRLYGNLDTRFSRDIDLIVREPDIGRTDELMRGLGYEWADRRLADDSLTSFFARHKEVQYVHPGDRVLVEIHKRLQEDSSVFLASPEILERHRVEVDLFGCRIPTFDDEFLLAYLAFHGSNHYWKRLFWLADVCVLSRLVGPEKREAAMRLANGYGCARQLASVGAMGDAISDLSGNVRLAGLPRRVSRYLFDVWDNSHLDGDGWFTEADPGRRLSRLSYEVHFIDGVLPTTRYLARSIFRQRDQDLRVTYLPRRLRYLGYPVRFCRLALRYFAAGPWRWLCRGLRTLAGGFLRKTPKSISIP